MMVSSEQMGMRVDIEKVLRVKLCTYLGSGVVQCKGAHGAVHGGRAGRHKVHATRERERERERLEDNG